jgi:hypothetical protein
MRPRRSKRWNEFSALIPKPEAQLLFADGYIMRRDITADLLPSLAKDAEIFNIIPSELVLALDTRERRRGVRFFDLFYTNAAPSM